MKMIQQPTWVLLFSGLSLASLTPLLAKAEYPACPQNQTAEEIEKWRKAAVSAVTDSRASSYSFYGERENDPFSKLTTSIESCFPTQVPACLQRAHDYAEQQWVDRLPVESDTPEDEKRRVLPKEFWDESSVQDGKPTRFTMFQKINGSPGYKDIEQIAREKGWPMVRYKTRMSGGFDTTPSLLMIRVPGNKLTPPVGYDQYVNIPIPAEPGDATGPIDQIKSVPEKKLPGPADYENNSYLPSTVTVVTVDKKQGDKPGKVYFTFYRRSGSTFLREDEPNPKGACYSCHPNGVRAISPYGFNVRDSELAHGILKPEAQWLATQEMNNSMNQNNGFNLVDWGKVKDPSGKLRPYLNPAGMGPVIGPIHPLNHKVITGEDGQPKTIYPTRTKEFIVGEDGRGGCARNFNGFVSMSYNTQPNQISLGDGRGPSRTNLFTLTDNPPINWQKVKDQMSCASCHNNRIRGALNSKTSFNEVAFKILVDQSMPVGVHTTSRTGNGSVHDDLNPSERIALVNCLREEFRVERNMIPEWLTQVSCSNDSSANVTSAIHGVFPQTVVGTPVPVPPQGVTTRSAPVTNSSRNATPPVQPTSTAGRAE